MYLARMVRRFGSLLVFAAVQLAVELAVFPAFGQESQPAEVQAQGASTPPRLVHFVQADYPAEALAAGLHGSVLLSLEIDTEGHVTEASVITPAGHGFDEAALVAARQFVFAPARRNGEAIAARIRYRYRFSPYDAPAQAPTPRSVTTQSQPDVSVPPSRST